MSGTIASSSQSDRWSGLRGWLMWWFGRPESPSSQVDEMRGHAGGPISSHRSHRILAGRVTSSSELCARSNRLSCPDPRAQMMSLLARVEGVTVAEIAEATGWQAHSVRAALSGLRKRGVRIERMGLNGRACRYRVTSAEADNASPSSSLASATAMDDTTSPPGVGSAPAPVCFAASAIGPESAATPTSLSGISSPLGDSTPPASASSVLAADVTPSSIPEGAA